MKDLTFSVKMSILSRLIIVLTVSNGRQAVRRRRGSLYGHCSGDGDLGNVNMATLTHVAPHITSG